MVITEMQSVTLKKDVYNSIILDLVTKTALNDIHIKCKLRGQSNTKLKVKLNTF